MSKSIVILAVPLMAADAMTTLTGLSQHQLVDPLLLIDQHGLTTLLDRGSRTDIELLTYLASHRLDSVRFVSLTLFAAGVTQTVDGVTEQAQQLRTRCSRAGVGFKAISVVVVDHQSRAPEEAFHADWEDNLVFVPEDSTGSRGMTSVDLDATKVPHVAVSAAVTIGGAWTWLDGAPLSNDQVQFVQNERRASVARLSVRLIDAGDLTSRVVNWALDPAGIWPIPTNTVAHGSPQESVRELADKLACGREVGFAYRQPKAEHRGEPTRIGLFAALVLFFRNFWTHIRATPARQLRATRDAAFSGVEEFAQNKTFGRDSEIAIKIGSSPKSIRELVDGSARLELLHSLPQLNVPAPRATPDTWTTTRSVVFGLVDGANFMGSMEGSELKWQSQHAVLDNRALVVAPFEGSDGAFTVSDDEALVLQLGAMPSNNSETLRIGSADAASARLFDGALNEAEERIQRRKADLRRHRSQTPPTKSRTRGLVGLAKNSFARSMKTSWAYAVSRTRFSSWTEARRQTLVWKLGEHIDHTITDAVASFSRTEAELQSLVEELESYDDRERTLLRRLRVRTTLLFLALLVVLASAVASFFVLSFTWTVGTVVLFLATVALVGFGFISSAREEVRFEHRLTEIQHGPYQLLELRSHAASEIARLTHLNNQLSDWSDIYSHVIHHPWGVLPPVDAINSWTAPTEILSFASGAPQVNPDQLHGEILRLRRQICGPRWLTSNFLEVVSLWRERYSQMAAIGDGESAGPENDASSSDSPISTIPGTTEPLYTPRVQFKRELIEGRYSEALRATQTTELRETLGNANAGRLIRQVRCDLPGLDGLTPNEFLGSLIRFSELPGFEDYFRPALPPIPTNVQRSISAISEGVPVELPKVGVEPELVHAKSVAERFVLGAFRLDLSEETNIDKISLIQISDEGQTAPRLTPVTPRGPTEASFLG